MNSLLSTPLVPEKEVYPVCTNGLQTGTMVVTSQNKMCNAKRHYIATYLDKPTDFKCVYAGILVAIIGGIITALVASGVGATIAGLLIATLAGVIASYGLGGAVCRYCLESAVWDKFHPNIIIDGKFAIVGSSKLICTPLPFLTPGRIEFFYDKDVANKTAEIYATQNVLRIFGGATTGWGITKLLPKLPSFLGGLTTNGFTSLTVFKLGSITLSVFVIPDWICEGEDIASDFFSDVYTKNNSDEYKRYTHSNKDSYEPYESTSKAVEGLNDFISWTNRIGTATSKPRGTAFKVGWFFEKLDPRYFNKKTSGLSSTYAKEGWSVVKGAKNQQLQNASIEGKMASAVLYMDILGNLIGKTIYKCMAKNLTKWADDAELEARNKIGVYEYEIK